jgi:hypothetical protein
MDLHDLLKRPECKTLAFKRDLSSPDGALKTIVTFANTAGGTLQSGVEDRSRNVRGVSDGWILAGRFAGSDKSRILDRIEIHSFPVQAVEEASAFVQKHSWHGTSIGAVRRTDRWSLPPPIFEEIATRLRVTIPTVPVGPTVVIATEQAIIISLKPGQGHAHAAGPSDRSRAGARDRHQRQGSAEKVFPSRGWSPMNLMPEQRARLDIDVALVAAGWILQNREAINLAAGPGSYSQHNTVVHKVGCLYCGIPHRNIILMNLADIARAGFRGHQRVTVQEEAGELQNVEIISGEIRAGAALMFYPEVNAIFKAVIDSRSGTPAFKRVPVLVRAERGAVADAAAGLPI